MANANTMKKSRCGLREHIENYIQITINFLASHRSLVTVQKCLTGKKRRSDACFQLGLQFFSAIHKVMARAALRITHIPNRGLGKLNYFLPISGSTSSSRPAVLIFVFLFEFAFCSRTPASELFLSALYLGCRNLIHQSLYPNEIANAFI